MTRNSRRQARDRSSYLQQHIDKNTRDSRIVAERNPTGLTFSDLENAKHELRNTARVRHPMPNCPTESRTSDPFLYEIGLHVRFRRTRPPGVAGVAAAFLAAVALAVPAPTPFLR